MAEKLEQKKTLISSQKLFCIPFQCCSLSHMIFSFIQTKRSWHQNIQEFLHLKFSAPFIFLICFFNWMLHPLIFLIRFSDRIKPSLSVYKLVFQIFINTYELVFVASTSFTIYLYRLIFVLQKEAPFHLKSAFSISFINHFVFRASKLSCMLPFVFN